LFVSGIYVKIPCINDIVSLPIVIIIMVIIIDMHTDKCGNTGGQECRAKESGKEVKIQEVRYRDTTKVEPEMYDYTGYNWNHWNNKEKLKVKSGNGAAAGSRVIPGKEGLCQDKIIIIMIIMFCVVGFHRHFLPGIYAETAVTPTSQVSRF
jgi:hypothetical protein